ncbi:endolytic transglycosylase MltG [Rhodococcus sp. SJ-2]
MSRDGRYGDDTPDTRHGGMFSDPYAGTYDTAGRYTPPGPDPAPRREEYGQNRPADGRHPDDDPTNILHFDEGVFDGPPPHRQAGFEDERGGARHDDEYVGGYSYAQRREDDYYDGAEYDEPGVFDRTETIAAIPVHDDMDADSWDDERAAPAVVGATTEQRAESSASAKRRRRGKVVGSLAAVLLLIVVVGGGYFAYDRFMGPGLPPDFAGPPGPVAIVQVHAGETATEISSEVADKGVTASAGAFYNAAVQNAGMNAVHPGFYAIPTNISGVDAVTAFVSPESRVGALVISEGRQLHDIRDVNTGAVRKGIYTLIAEASCYDDAGVTQCLTYEELVAAGASADLDALGVPAWARDAVAQVPDRERQLEGLIAAGSWDFDPSAEPGEVLRTLVTGSAARYDETGISAAAPKVGLTPYELLVAASLVEREAMPDDFARVARVILNRLEIDQMLQFDSTVNYALDETELATTDADRARVTPWNTYASVGLPATPISSPSIGALQAVENPEPGEWTYFVTIDDQGTTLFADTYEEHLVNTQLALESGILDSGR